jgi:cellulose biosynthesis protein BcsQ
LKIYEKEFGSQHFDAAIVANNCYPGNSLYQSSVENDLYGYAEDYDVPVFNTKLHRRVKYQEARGLGVSMDDMFGRDYESAQIEFSNFYKEVKKWITNSMK